jgi:hypothetical protein
LSLQSCEKGVFLPFLSTKHCRNYLKSMVGSGKHNIYFLAGIEDKMSTCQNIFVRGDEETFQNWARQSRVQFGGYAERKCFLGKTILPPEDHFILLSNLGQPCQHFIFLKHLFVLITLTILIHKLVADSKLKRWAFCCLHWGLSKYRLSCYTLFRLGS